MRICQAFAGASGSFIASLSYISFFFTGSEDAENNLTNSLVPGAAPVCVPESLRRLLVGGWTMEIASV